MWRMSEDMRSRLENLGLVSRGNVIAEDGLRDGESLDISCTRYPTVLGKAGGRGGRVYWCLQQQKAGWEGGGL